VCSYSHTPFGVTEGVRKSWHGRHAPEPIQPRTIIEVGGFYLVEAVDEPDDWYMGERGSDGVIVCWSKYGDIETALRGL
jgi:hypothetical protein